MRNLEDLIVMATRHVADGHRIVQRQRDLVARRAPLSPAHLNC
jgi:hypothetical protein